MAKPLYDREHQRRRALSEPAVNAGGVCCGFCGREIVAAKIRLRPSVKHPQGRLVSNWDWDHKTQGPAHLGCNRRDGGRNAARTTNAKRRRAAVVVGVFGPLSSG